MATTIEKKPAELKTQSELPKNGTNKVTKKGLVYGGPGKIELKEISKPVIEKPTDALVKIIKTTICGSDLGILHGKTPICKSRIGKYKYISYAFENSFIRKN